MLKKHRIPQKTLSQIKSEFKVNVRKIAISRSLEKNSLITFERMNVAPRIRTSLGHSTVIHQPKHGHICK